MDLRWRHVQQRERPSASVCSAQGSGVRGWCAWQQGDIDRRGPSHIGNTISMWMLTTSQSSAIVNAEHTTVICIWKGYRWALTALLLTQRVVLCAVRLPRVAAAVCARIICWYADGRLTIVSESSFLLSCSALFRTERRLRVAYNMKRNSYSYILGSNGIFYDCSYVLPYRQTCCISFERTNKTREEYMSKHFGKGLCYKIRIRKTFDG